MAKVRIDRLTNETLLQALREAIAESREEVQQDTPAPAQVEPVADEPSTEAPKTSDVLTTRLEHPRGDIMVIRYSPSREMCVKEVRADGKLQARDRKRDATLANYRGEIRRSVKWGWKILSTSETDL
ncbi:hypothetical protein [Streptomyces sp. 6N106]|uniref:hypothetical protein n=1 Tax=Streptomyces sp. 6N106 TaxID=3457418 RepID=UPI003FD2051C